MTNTKNLIDPNFPEFGECFDLNRDTFTLYQAAMVLAGKEPAESFVGTEWKTFVGMNEITRSLYHALVKAVADDQFSIIPTLEKDGTIDGFKTSIPRKQLLKWFKNHGGDRKQLESGQPLEQPEIGTKEWRTQVAKKAANTRHGQPGGYKEKRKLIRDKWATGNYPTRNACAKNEHGGLGVSEKTARNALIKTPDPDPWPACRTKPRAQKP